MTPEDMTATTDRDGFVHPTGVAPSVTCEWTEPDVLRVKGSPLAACFEAAAKHARTVQLWRTAIIAGAVVNGQCSITIKFATGEEA